MRASLTNQAKINSVPWIIFDPCGVKNHSPSMEDVLKFNVYREVADWRENNCSSRAAILSFSYFSPEAEQHYHPHWGASTKI